MLLAGPDGQTVKNLFGHRRFHRYTIAAETVENRVGLKMVLPRSVVALSPEIGPRTPSSGRSRKSASAIRDGVNTP